MELMAGASLVSRASAGGYTPSDRHARSRTRAFPTTTKPFLDSGDRLSRAEFHRRYLQRPDIRRAELIDGVVYVASPTRFAFHDEQAAALIGWLMAYKARHPE